MDVPSLACRTDLALARLAGAEVVDHGDHISVRTLDNPTYYGGNYLLLPSAPSPEELEDWEQVFSRTFPGAGHRTYGVATAHGVREDMAAFAAAGLDVDASTVMTARSVHGPPRPNQVATYRVLHDDDDWRQQVDLWLADPQDGTSEEFVTAKVEAERHMTQTGAGAWWGAFVDGRLCSSLGLFAASPGLARFQNVQTRPDARGQGLAGTLVERAGRFGLEELEAETLVMVADPDYHAVRVYRSVGFEHTEVQLQALRRPATSASEHASAGPAR